MLKSRRNGKPGRKLSRYTPALIRSICVHVRETLPLMFVEGPQRLRTNLYNRPLRKETI